MKYPYFPKIFFDSCSFHPPQINEKIAMSEVEKIISNLEDVTIEIPHSVRSEMSKAPAWIQAKAALSIYTLPTTLTDEERRIIDEIRLLLFDKYQDLRPNEKMDIIHIFEAQKYGCRYFVTLDKKHLLSKRTALWNRFQLKVLPPSECLEEIKNLI